MNQEIQNYLKNGKHLELIYEKEMRQIAAKIKEVEKEEDLSTNKEAKKEISQKMANLYEKFFKAGKSYLEVREQVYNLLFFSGK